MAASGAEMPRASPNLSRAFVFYATTRVDGAKSSDFSVT
jgi:hypothetical protein